MNDARGIGRIGGRLGGLGRNAGRNIGSKGVSRVKDFGKRVFGRTGRRGGTSRTGGGFRARVSRTKDAGKIILGRSGNTGGSSRGGLRGGISKIKDLGKRIFGRSGTSGRSSSSGGLRGGLSKIKDFGKRIFGRSGNRGGASSTDGGSAAGKGSTLKRVAKWGAGILGTAAAGAGTTYLINEALSGSDDYSSPGPDYYSSYDEYPSYDYRLQDSASQSIGGTIIRSFLLSRPKRCTFLTKDITI